MIPISNNIIAGQTNAVFSSYALDQFNASTRAITAGATSDPSLCLDDRIYDLRNRIQEIPQTNFISNNTMVGASGGPLPNTWEAQDAPSLSQTITTSGTASGFQTVGVILSGTADTDNEVYVQFGTSGIVSTYQGDLFVGSAYFQLSSGSVSGITDIGLEIAIIDSTNPGIVLESFKTTFPDLSSGFVRFSVSGKVSVQGSTDDSLVATMRFSHNVLGGSSYDYRVIIGVPQLERGLEASPVITTSTGSVTRITGRPSILVVPQLTKEGVVYPQIPVVSGADFTFSRNTSATRVNSSGLIESVASGVPRIDWLGQSCPALLVEASGQNGILNSADTTTNWTLGANLTSGAIDVIGVSGNNITIAVSGSGIGSAAGRFVRFNNNVAFASGSTYTISFLIKKTGAHTIGGYQIIMSSGSIGSGFDVSGSFASGSNVDTAPTTNRIRRIEQFGTDVFRCSETFTMTAAATGTHLAFGPVSTINVTTNSAVGTSIGFAAPQIELGAFPTSFIPTTTAVVSRAADVCSVSGVSGYIGQTEGTIYAEVDMRNLGDGRFASVSDGTTNNRIQCRFNLANNGVDFVVVVSGASVGFSISNSTHPSFPATIPAGTYKIALAYKQNDYVVAMNGTTYTPLVTSRNVPLNFSKVTIGSDVSDLNQFNNRIRAAALYTTRLSNAQLTELTRL